MVTGRNIHPMFEVLEMAVYFRLQELLDEQDPPLSQAELARKSGVSLVTVNAMAKNRTTRVDLATLDAISGALGCEPGELFVREARPRRKKSA